MRYLYHQKHSISLRILLAVISVCMWHLLPSSAQGETIRDSRGTEFWLTFTPNFHNNPNPPRDSLYIYITAEQAASGTIEYFDIAGDRFTKSFNIGKDEFFIFSTAFTGFELSGINSPNGNNPSPQNEQPAPQVFHITSSTEVTVYGLSQAETTSDAFIALPTDVLGQDYIVMSHNAIPSNGTDYNTPSQFAIVATQDNTQITITPSAPTSRRPSTAPWTTTLNKGQAYLVQTRSGTTDDLTGTAINATKPIAVFSGHQRTKIPATFASRDYLVEQLPPIPSWGGSAFITPYPLANGASASLFDKYRVLAAHDNTQVFIDGILVRTLQAREFFEDDVKQAQWITATGPLLVAQFKKSSNQSGGSNNSGDPFMIINSPVEQYLERYHCFNVKAWEGTRADIYGLEQYVTIIVPTDSVATVKLNGTPIPASRFTPLSITSYSYTPSLRVQTGINTIEANVGVGVYVYGYGSANSYGYIGGMKYDTIYTFDPPDIIPPLVLGERVCDSLTGGVYDTLAFDQGIEQITITDQNNVDILIDSIAPPARSVDFRAKLRDPFADGSFTLFVRDSANAKRAQEFDIPGFTVRAQMATDNTSLPTTSATMQRNQQTCATISITNYGKFTQDITEEDFRSAGFTVTTPLPIRLLPSVTRTIEVCFTSQKEGIFRDTLFLGNNCHLRPVIALEYTVFTPLALATTAQCEVFNGIFYDTAFVKLNINKVEAVPSSLQNTAVTIGNSIPVPASTPFTARLIDPYQDGQGKVVAHTDYGIQGEIDFTIPGFTVHPNPGTFALAELSDTARIKNQRCLSVELTNYGKFERTVSVFRFANSSPEFHVQPPMATIPSGGRTTVQICFYSEEEGDFIDTLIIGNECAVRPVVALAILAQKDSRQPAIAVSSDPCALSNAVVFSDTLKTDWGIASFSVVEQVNCTVDTDVSQLPTAMRFDIQAIDRRADAKYRIQVADSAGNIRDTTIIIQGFTLSFPSITASGYDFTSSLPLSLRCDSIPVYNSSELPFVIDNADLLGNTRFSAPLSQFPVTVAPRDTGYITLCFEPYNSAAYNDTLRLAKYCLEELIPLNGSKDIRVLQVESKCNVGIRLSTGTQPVSTFMRQNFPNPAADATTLRFGIARDMPVYVYLYNTFGERIATLVHGTYKAGIYEVDIEMTSMESGVYFYEMQTPHTRIVKMMNIVR